MDIIAEVRRRHLVSGESISSISRSLKISRPTVRKHLSSVEEPIYKRDVQPEPKLGSSKILLIKWLEIDRELPKNQRRTARRLFEGLVDEGYQGAYDSIQRFVKQWKIDHKQSASAKQAFVPLVFQAGDVCQFDWSMETVEIGGRELKIKVAHFRLAHSRKMFVIAYPRETQEMLMDAHNQAFEFYGGVPLKMIYDNLKTVVDTVFTGKERKFNRRFMALANHYLFEPIACTPAAGWEKGQVENQVGNIREWLFTPRAKFDSFNDLNVWLKQRCDELSSRIHPTLPSQTIAEVFQQEKPHLRVIEIPFVGYLEHLLKVSRTCLIRLDRHDYSVPAKWVGQIVSVRVMAYSLSIVAGGEIIAEHPRSFIRDEITCNPWHYLPVLEKKPGALRHGLPFQDWDLPKTIQVVRQRLMAQNKGDKAFVDCLVLAKKVGLETFEIACDIVLESGSVTGSIVLNEMRRLAEPNKPKALTLSENLQLKNEPQANVHLYDHLLGAHNVH